MNRAQEVDHPGWEGWFFEDGFLCSPNGDKFHPLIIMACFFWKQLSEVRSLWQTGSKRDDGLLVRSCFGPGNEGRWEIKFPRKQAREAEPECSPLGLALRFGLPGDGIEQ